MKAVAKAEAAQAALAHSTVEASRLTEELTAARKDMHMHEQVEGIYRQHAAAAAQAETAVHLQALQQQVESQRVAAAAARAGRDQAQQGMLQLQAQLSDAAVQQQEKEAAVRLQLTKHRKACR
jgi:hypothetical protein